MVMDSLRYWVTAVPRRRLSLRPRRRRSAASRTASIPARASSTRCAQDPVLAAREADLRALGHRSGRLPARPLHPPGFAEWNDRFRDAMRALLARRSRARAASSRRGVAGSSDLFDRRARRPWASVNYAASHDGFTLRRRGELRRDAQRGERRGQSRRPRRQLSANWGVEGPTDDPAISATRAPRAARAARDRVLLARHADAARRRRVRPHPARQQQCLLPGQRDLLARLEAGRNAAGAGAHRLCGAAHRAAARESGAALPPFPARQGRARARDSRHRLVRHAWRDHLERILEQSGEAPVRAAPRLAERRRNRSDPDLVSQSEREDRVFRLPDAEPSDAPAARQRRARQAGERHRGRARSRSRRAAPC